MGNVAPIYAAHLLAFLDISGGMGFIFSLLTKKEGRAASGADGGGAVAAAVDDDDQGALWHHG